MITRNRITGRIVAGLLLGLVPVVAIAAVLLTRASQSSLRTAYEANVTSGLNHQLGETRAAVERALELWVANPSFTAALESAVEFGDAGPLETRAAETRAAARLQSIRLLDLKGAAQAKSEVEGFRGPDPLEVLRRATEGVVAAGTIESSAAGIQVAAWRRVALRGKPVGVIFVVAAIDASQVSLLGRALNGQLALLQGENLFAAGDRALESFRADPAILADTQRAGQSVQRLRDDASGPQFVTYVPLANLGRGPFAVTGVVVTSAAEYQAAAGRSLRLWIATSSILVLVSVVLAFFLGRRIGGSIQAAIGTLETSVAASSSAASQVLGASRQFADSASAQAASLEETAASLEEMSSMTRRNAEGAETAKGMATEAREAADAGENHMKSMIAAMDGISAASGDITKILRTIDEIAFQTNILALNAAVEAARAGVAGAGFAVVADEVRNLAQRSAAAARETAQKIEDSVERSRQGSQISRSVADSFAAIQQRIRRLDTQMGEIATASVEQTRGIQEIARAVSDMDQRTQGNAASAEETAASAEELGSQSRAVGVALTSLQSLVGTRTQPQAPRSAERRPSETLVAV